MRTDTKLLPFCAVLPIVFFGLFYSFSVLLPAAGADFSAYLMRPAQADPEFSFLKASFT